MTLTPPVVLLADDPTDYRASVAFHLAMSGYPVVEAASVDGVIAEARRLRPDVVVVSDRLAAGDLADLLDILVAEHSLAGVPIITVSAAAGPERLVESLRSGARDHVRQQDGTDELVARVDAVVRIGQELERLRRRNAELEFLGSVDPVTGMATRRQIQDELDRLSAGAARHDLPLAVAMVRVDDPPAPMAAGALAARDAVLEEVAFLLAAVRRTDDFSGTWDAKTFVVLLPVTTLEGARVFVERLRAVVTAAPVRAGDALIPVTLSASYAVVGADVAGLLERMEAAVAALQRAGGDGIITG